jgi:hypothetical protein
VKLALQQDRHLILLEDIRKINTDLAELAMHQSQMTSITPRTLPRHYAAAENYNRTRNHARSLYDVLQTGFRLAKCKCQEPHNANLRLHRPGRDESRLKVLFQFEDISTKECDWRTLEFELVPCDPSAERAPEILLGVPDGPCGIQKHSIKKRNGIKEAWSTVASIGSRIARSRSPLSEKG